MLLKRNLKTILTCCILICNAPKTAIAQELNVSKSPNKQISQIETDDSQKKAPAKLFPNPNPLFFPTKPKEVEIENQNIQSVSLEEAIEIALKNNKDLQIARLELQRSEAELRAALADQLPTLDGQLEFTKNEQDISTSLGTSETAARDTESLTGQIELGYNVYDGGRRDANITRSRRQVHLSKLEIERISEETRFTTTNSYYELQNSDAQVAIAQAAVEDFSQTLRDAQLLERAGLGTKFDVLQAEVDLANANQALTRGIANQRTARRQLAQILSIGQQVELTAADPIEEAGVWAFSLEESIVKAYKNRVELEEFLVQKEINEQDREIALSSIRPQVSLFANYFFTDTFKNNIESDGLSVDTATGYLGGYNVGARVTWRFFDGGRAFAEQDAENRNIDIDETNFAKQRDQIRLQVESAYYQMVANKENISTTEKAVITATESLRLARLRFQAGVGTQTDVINAQRSLTESRGNFLQAVIGYNQSLNELQRAVSNLPDEKLFEAL